MANSIEIPVRLSLEQAQSQAEELRRMLRESVQPNSSEFRAISTMIERAVTQAERLKQTMGESFKTSSGSKKFNGELQKTFDLLATATGRLKNVSAGNLILSDSELQRANQITSEIERLQSEIDSLSSKKIGSFFDSSADQKLKDVADLANTLGLNISSMTFSGLSEKLSKESVKVNSDLEKIRGNIESLKNAQAAVGKNDGTSFISDMIKGTQAATRLSAGAAKTVEDQLTTVFSKYQDLFNGKAFEIGDINTKSNIPTIMHNQFDAIDKAIDPEIQNLDEKIQKYEAALQRLNNVQTSGFKKGGAGAAASKASAAEIKAAAEAIGIQLRDRGKDANGHTEDLGAYKEYAEKEIQSLLDTIKNSRSKFQEARTELISSINSIFENIGESTQIDNKNGFKEFITSWLDKNGIDSSAKEIQLALASVMKDSFSGDVFQNLQTAISEYLTRALQEAGVQESEATTKAQAFASALSTVNGVITSNNGKITVNKEKLAALNKQLGEVGENAKKAFGEKIDANPIFSQAKGQYEQATQALQKYTTGLANLESKQQALGNIQNAVTRWMGFYQVLNLGKKAIQDMKNHIQELDTVMTQIAVVTNMSQDDLWGQIGKYSQIARQYGVAIKGVYEVSQIYYQQGLNQGDVMNLTTETLKMARIAGLDYATAADYMTTAIRGFKLEMTDAAHVTDVYSALAAKTASSTEELAVAISKTASSAEAVGSSFEATSAMMATMISVTRESATNIGTALKSVISRYGEMTSDPSKLVDSEGEEMNLNRVDKALKTIGITIQDVNGQFRDFDDVILELGEKWDTLDKNSQRYIATLMAGNRQQSRFLSLVGNIDEYKNALEIAQNSENAGELQTLKTLDSVDAKIEKMKVTVQEFYTSAGIQDLYKGILDTITNVMDAANNLPKAFGKIPLAALTIGAQIIAAIKNIVSLAINYVSMAINAYKTKFNSIITSNFQSIQPLAENEGRKIGTSVAQGIESGLQASRTSFSKTVGAILSAVTAVTSTIAAEQSIEALNDYGASTGKPQDQAAAAKMYTAAGLQGVGALSTILSGALMGGLPGAFMGLASAIPSIISGITALNSASSMYNVTLERELELSNKRVEAARQESVKAKGEISDLQSSINKLKQLEEVQYSSAEAMQDYIDYRNQLIETYPELLSGYDSEYNAIIETSKAYEILAQKISLALQKQVEYDSNNRDNAHLRAEAAKSYSQKLSEASQDKYSTATAKGVTTFITTGDLNQATYKTQYERMSQAGAFSGVFDELISSNKKRAEDYVSLGKYSEALNELQAINKIILSEGEAYTKLLEEQTSISYRQSSALLGATQKIEATYGAEEVVDFYNNNFLRSMFSSTIKYLHNAGNIDENNKVLSETFGEGELSLEEYGALLGNSLFKLYNNLLEDQQKELSQVIKNRDKYSSSDAYKKALESIIGEGLIPEDAWEGQEKDYAAAQTSALDRLEAYSEKQSKNGDKYINQFAALFEGETNLSSDYVNAILEDAKYYDSQINSGLLIYGNNIAEKMLAYWTAIGAITDENKQIELSDKLRAIDRQDANELDKLIDNLENEEGYTKEGEIGQVVEALKEYKAALSVSINTLTAEYINNIKTAETNITDINKIQKSGFSNFEDMSKAFQQLNKAGFTGTWEKAFTFDDGTWKYSAEAYRIAISKINDTLEADNKSLTQRITALNTANDSIREQASKYNFFTEYNFDGFNKALRAFDSEQMKQFLANLFKITDENVLNTITDQITAGIIPLGESMQEFYNNILAWIANQLGEAENQIKGANQFIINLKLSQLDISGIAGGTELTNEAYNKTLLFDALKAAKPDMQDTDIQTQVDTIWSELEDGVFTTFEKYFPGILSRATKQAASQSDFEQYQKAFSELLLGDSGKFSDSTIGLLNKLGIEVKDSMDDAVVAAGQVLELMRGQFDSISDYNANAKTLLEKSLQLSQVNKQKAIYDFATNGISIDSIFNLADSLNQYVDEFINLTTGEIKSESLNKVLTYNQWTGTYDITGTAEAFIAALHDTFGLEIKKTSTEYLQIVENIFNSQAKRVSERNDLLVKARERQDQTAIKNAVKNLTFTGKGAFGSLDQINALANALQVDINTLIGEYIAELDAYALKVDITELDLKALDDVKDAIADNINKFIESIVSLISSGLSGKMSRTDFGTLQASIAQLAGKDVADSLDFTETANGLKLTNRSAIQLYSTLKQIDKAGSELMFEDLKNSFLNSDPELSNAAGLMARIRTLEGEITKAEADANEAAVTNHNDRANAARATADALKQELSLYKDIAQSQQFNSPDSYKFMDQSLPDYLQGPVNYWDSWGKAFGAMNDAAKTGTMGIADFRNIVNEMNNIAAISGQSIDFFGTRLNGSLESAANLIERGFGAIQNVDGKGAVINLAGIGLNFQEGANAMGQNVEDGIHAMASSQIEMLDGMIALLETVVAMEKLSAVAGDTGDANTIDIGDLFPEFTFEGETQRLKNNLAVQEWAQKLIDADPTSDLGKAIDGIIWNSKSLRQWIDQAKNGIGLTKQEAEELAGVIDGFYQMWLSNDYDLDNLIPTIEQIAEKAGVVQEFKLGDTTMAIGYGVHLTKSKKSNDYEVNGKHYSNAESALQAQVLSEQENLQEITIDGKTEQAIIIKGTTYIATFEDGHFFYKDSNGGTYNNISEIIQAKWDQLSPEDKQGYKGGITEFTTELGFSASLSPGNIVIDQKKLDGASHEAMEKFREAIQKLISGEEVGNLDTITADVGVKINTDIKNISEADYQTLLKTAGIEEKTINMDIKANAPTGEGAPILAELMKNETVTKTVFVNIEPQKGTTGPFTNGTTDGTTDGTEEPTEKPIDLPVVHGNVQQLILDTIANIALKEGYGDLNVTNPVTQALANLTLLLLQAQGIQINNADNLPNINAISSAFTTLTSLMITSVGGIQLSPIARALLLLYQLEPVSAMNAILQTLNLTGAPTVTDNQITKPTELPTKIESLPVTVLTLLLHLINKTPNTSEIDETVNSVTAPSIPELESILQALSIAYSGTPEQTQIDNAIKAVKANDIPSLVSALKALLISFSGTPNTAEVDSAISKIKKAKDIESLTSAAKELIIAKGWTTPEEAMDLVPSTWTATNSVNQVKAAVAQLVLSWLGAPNIDSSAILGSGPIDLGVRAGQVKISSIGASLDTNLREAFVGDIPIEESENILASVKAQYMPGEGAYDFDSVITQLEIDPGALETAWIDVQEYFGHPLPLTFAEDGSAVIDTDALRTQIENWLKGFNPELDLELGLTSDMTEDEAGLVEQTEQMVEVAQNTASDHPIKIPTEADREAFLNSVLGLTADAGASDVNFNVPVTVDKDTITADVQAAAEQAQAAADNNIITYQTQAETTIETPNVLNAGVLSTTTATISVALGQIDSTIQEILNGDIERTVKLNADTSAVSKILETLKNLTSTVTINQITQQNASTNDVPTANVAFSGAGLLGDVASAAQAAANSINQIIKDNLQEQTLIIKGDTGNAESAIRSLQNLASQSVTKAIYAETDGALAAIKQVDAAASKSITKKVEVKTVGATGAGIIGGGLGTIGAMTRATGNIALAKGRQTLMGELGPELYVTHGHYYVAGQNGAEFIDLPDDAIVFNHIQTRKLLDNGSGGRGKPVTNERKATSLATGNTSGPAMASAAAALAALKQIRAMWQSMLNASLSDLGQQAGGGGGGGGGGGKKKNTIDPGFIADLERWYNLLRQIDKLEKDINYQEQLRTKIQSDRIVNGKALYDSYKKSLAQLDQEVIDHQQLAFLQKDYYDKRRQTLEQETNYGKIFTFNEEGLMQYNDQAVMANGDRGGLFALGKLNAQNPDGSTVLSAEQQYKLLQSWGFGEDMVYDSSGKKITFGEDEEDATARENARQAGFTSAVQAFWDKADAWKDELDGLYDSYREQQEEILDADNKRNEILQEIVDNQIAIEDKVYNAIVDSRQRQIDDAQKERDAYEKSTQEFIDGLNKQLSKEREMYQQQQESDSLLRLRRQLAILQRSGGSASSIRSLQDQITQKEKDAYFDSQQKQIEAIQEASNLEIERLDAQIDLMTETLEYQKTYGLLWEQVAQIMRGTPSEINNFITSNGNDWMNYSTTKWDEEYRLLNGQIELWASYKNDTEAYRTTWDGFPITVQQAIAGLDEHSWHTYDEAMYDLFGEKWEGVRDAAYKYYTDQYNKSSDPNVAALITNQTAEIYDMIQSAMGARSSSVELESQAYQGTTPKSGNGGGAGGDGGDTGGSAGNGGGTTDKKGSSLGAVTGMVEGAKSIESRTLHISYAKKCTAGLYAGYSIGGSPSGPSTLLVGESGTVSHNPNPDFVKGGWSVSDGSKCRVSGGTITALAPGYVTVTMQYWYRGTNNKKVDTTIPTGTITVGSGGSVKKINAYETLQPYASGGMNEEPGPAMLHGTKSKPEAVLNPEQTRMLKEDILGGGSNSLLSSLVAFKNTLNNTVDGSKFTALASSTPSSDSVVIEHAEVNLNATIANDYDARRAGNLVMDEMVKIARKNGMQNNIRR